MPSTHPDPLYSRAEIRILACSKCGNPMRLSQIEPAAPVMMCGRSNARSAIPASVFRSQSNVTCVLEQTVTLEMLALSAFQDAMCRFGWAAALRGGEVSQDVNL